MVKLTELLWLPANGFGPSIHYQWCLLLVSKANCLDCSGISLCFFSTLNAFAGFYVYQLFLHCYDHSTYQKCLKGGEIEFGSVSVQPWRQESELCSRQWGVQWVLFTPRQTRKHSDCTGARYNLHRPTPTDLLLQASLHLINMPHLSKSSPSAWDKGSNHESVGHSLDSDHGYNVSSCLSAFSMMECAPNSASE